jgi:hypothetical protein
MFGRFGDSVVAAKVTFAVSDTDASQNRVTDLEIWVVFV